MQTLFLIMLYMRSDQGLVSAIGNTVTQYNLLPWMGGRHLDQLPHQPCAGEVGVMAPSRMKNRLRLSFMAVLCHPILSQAILAMSCYWVQIFHDERVRLVRLRNFPSLSLNSRASQDIKYTTSPYPPPSTPPYPPPSFKKICGEG